MKKQIVDAQTGELVSVDMTAEEIAAQEAVWAEHAELVEARRASRKVSAAQAKLALHGAGLLEAVQASVQAYAPMKIYFDNAGEWQRNHPYLLGMAAEMSLTDQQIDELFDVASTL